VDRHQQLQPTGSATEKGCTITHAVIASRVTAGSGSPQCGAVAYYAISTPGSGTVTIKWLDEQGHSGIVQVGLRRHAWPITAPTMIACRRTVADASLLLK
jgi:hypothetical protein